MTEATQDAVGSQNNAVKLIVVGVFLIAALFGAYKFTTARAGAQAKVQWTDAAAPQAGVNEFLPHTHPPGYVHPGGTPAGGTTAPAAAPPGGVPAVNTGGLISMATAATCELGGGATEPTINGVTGKRKVGTAKIVSGMQEITVTPGGGKYSPNVIRLKAGVPSEITFGQSSGCTGMVLSTPLNFMANLADGPKVVNLPGLKKGTYQFSCALAMVYGKIVVE